MQLSLFHYPDPRPYALIGHQTIRYPTQIPAIAPVGDGVQEQAPWSWDTSLRPTRADVERAQREAIVAQHIAATSAEGYPDTCTTTLTDATSSDYPGLQFQGVIDPELLNAHNDVSHDDIPHEVAEEAATPAEVYFRTDLDFPYVVFEGSRKPYVCAGKIGDTRQGEAKECGKLFARRSDLKKHQKCHIPEKDRPLKCPRPNCKKRWVHVKDVKRHLLSQHSDKKDFTCENCGKTFARKDGRQKHRDSKTGCMKEWGRLLAASNLGVPETMSTAWEPKRKQKPGSSTSELWSLVSGLDGIEVVSNSSYKSPPGH